MNPFTRREFLQRSAILSAAAAAVPAVTQAADEPVKASRSANDKLRVALVGVHGRGMSHVDGFLGKNNCDITHICDCDEGVITRAMDKVTKGQADHPPKYVKDFRLLLDNKDIDVIAIATPNHWHALMAVWAMRAGKDVYCEKPASHNVHEGRLMIEAARKYNRIIQVGTQSRSNPGMRSAIEYVQSGKIGDVTLAYGTCYKDRKSIGKVAGPQDPPKTMDYDLWCGPARVVQPQRKTGFGTVHYDWHWIWEYGNGDIGNQGVHEMDKARWGLNKPGLPTAVVSAGGRFGYVDDGQTPNTMVSLFEFPGAHLIFETRGLPTTGLRGAKVGNIWVGDKGYVVCTNYFSGVAYTPDGKVVEKWSDGRDQLHYDNFVKAVRSRKSSDLNCDISEGHLSAALCHLANISYRLGAETAYDKSITAFGGQKDGEDALARLLAHLKDNKVDLAKAMGNVGPKLTIDPKAEKFTGGADLAKANAMLFREYRKGFDITEAV